MLRPHIERLFGAGEGAALGVADEVALHGGFGGVLAGADPTGGGEAEECFVAERISGATWQAQEADAGEEERDAINGIEGRVSKSPK